MRLVFLFGQPAVGKLTVAAELARRTGFALFHNHLIVDAVAAVFPFGSEPFQRLREAFWLSVMEEAARTGRSLVFTFQPEPTVKPGFAERSIEAVRRGGGEISFVRLVASAAEQERRLGLPSRLQFDKMRSPEMLRRLRPACEICEAAMPQPAITIDTTHTGPAESAERIMKELRLAPA